jgi:hypothetical protein
MDSPVAPTSSTHVLHGREHAFTPPPIARVSDAWLCAPSEQALAGRMRAARRSALKAVAKSFEL